MRPCIDVGSLLANKVVAGSRSTTVLPQPLFPLSHDEAGRWRSSGYGSYAGTPRPDPWRGFASAAFAPSVPLTPLSFARSLGLVHASGAGCSCPLSVHSPWWRGMGSAGSEGSINKLVRCPDLEELHHPVLLSAVHLGGGRRDGRGSISGVHYLGSGSSPPVLEMKLRLRSSSTRRRPFWSNGGLVIPPGQVCQKGGSASSTQSLWCPPMSSASGGKAMEVASNQVVRPRRRCNWFCVEVAFGPNCNLVFLLGVLHVKVRDRVVIFLSFVSLGEQCTLSVV